jgi:hypothetical protein
VETARMGFVVGLCRLCGSLHGFDFTLKSSERRDSMSWL